ncbi:MAG: TfoX/Sxy family protein [Hyphomicrobiaceae bacterium]
MSGAPSIEECELAALPGLGPASARMLIEAGVQDVRALQRLGPVDAYRRLRFRFGGKVTLNFMYALECAVRRLDWRDLEQGRKDELKRAAREIVASLASPPSRRAGRTGNED